MKTTPRFVVTDDAAGDVAYAAGRKYEPIKNNCQPFDYSKHYESYRSSGTAFFSFNFSLIHNIQRYRHCDDSDIDSDIMEYSDDKHWVI